MASLTKLDQLVRQARQSLLDAYREGRLTEAEYAYRIGLVEGWLRARGYLHAGNPPLFHPRQLWRPAEWPAPPIVARLP